MRQNPLDGGVVERQGEIGRSIMGRKLSILRDLGEQRLSRAALWSCCWRPSRRRRAASGDDRRHPGAEGRRLAGGVAGRHPGAVHRARLGAETRSHGIADTHLEGAVTGGSRAADHLRRTRGDPAAVVARRPLHQLRIVAWHRHRRGRATRTGVPDAQRRRRGVRSSPIRRRTSPPTPGRPTAPASPWSAPSRARARTKRRCASATTSGSSRAISVMQQLWTAARGQQGDRPRHRRAASTRSWARRRGPPDSTRLVFSAKPTTMLRDDRSDVYVADSPSGAIEKISTNPGPDVQPQWSPDGDPIAWVERADHGRRDRRRDAALVHRSRPPDGLRRRCPPCPRPVEPRVRRRHRHPALERRQPPPRVHRRHARLHRGVQRRARHRRSTPSCRARRRCRSDRAAPTARWSSWRWTRRRRRPRFT